MARIKKGIKKIIQVLTTKELVILPASLAYYFVLAFIPIITIIVIIASFFSISTDNVIEMINNTLPSFISSYIVPIIAGKEFDFSLGVLVTLTFGVACNGTYAIITASNSLYKVENSNAIKNRFKSFLLLFIIIVLFLFLILFPVLGGKILSILESFKFFENIIDELLLTYKIIKWPMTFLIIFLNIKLIYTIAPSIKVESSSTTLGAFVTTIGWALFTALFGYYLKYFGKYDLIYGSLSSLMVLLIWLYALSYILILGIVINTREYNKK